MSNIIAVSTKAITKLKTPQILKLGLFFTWGGCILVLITTIGAIKTQSNAIKTVGQDATPSIILAQRLKDGFAGMDAFVVKELLVPPTQSQNFVGGYEERYKEITKRLVAAAKNITYGEKEQKPIEAMQWWFGKYLIKVQRAQDFHEHGDTNNVLVSYREALDILDKQLFPASDDLDHVNLNALEEVYASGKLSTQLSLLMILISSLLLIGILIGLQLFINLRMRRIFNPLLMLATGISIAFLAYASGAFLSAMQNLTIAKENAFSSMYVLRRARYNNYSANAAQGRYLLDPALAAKHQQDFNNYVTLIAKLPNDKTYEQVVNEIKASSSNSNRVTGFTGFIADELANITFPGEKEAALKMLSAFGKYLVIDQKIRLLEQSGKHPEAIALYVGTNEGESNWAFDIFRKANGDTFDVNNAAFETAIKQGSQDMAGFEVTAPIVLGAIAVLTLFGLTPRMKEYS